MSEKKLYLVVVRDGDWHRGLFTEAGSPEEAKQDIHRRYPTDPFRVESVTEWPEEEEECQEQS